MVTLGSAQTHDYLAVKYGAAIHSQSLCRRFHAGKQDRRVDGVVARIPRNCPSTEAATDVNLRDCAAQYEQLFEVRIFDIRTELFGKFSLHMKQSAAG